MTTRYIECPDAATLNARAAQIDSAYMQAMRARLARGAAASVDTVVDSDGYAVSVAPAITTSCVTKITRAGTAGGLIPCGRIVRRLHELGLIDASDAKLRSALRLVWRTELAAREIADDTGTADDADIVNTTIRTR